MDLSQVFDIFASIVGVAGLTVFLTSAQTANIITAVGNAFSTSLKAAMGR